MKNVLQGPNHAVLDPYHPNRELLKSRNVVEESTKYKRTPTDVDWSTNVFSNHAPVALTSIAA